MLTKFAELHIQNIKKIYRVFIIFKYAYWQYRWRILVTTLLGFVSSLLGGLGISMLIPLFALVTQKDNTATSDTFHHIVSQIFSLLHLNYNLPILLILMVSLFISKAIITILTIHISDRISARYNRDISSALFKKTLEADWTFLMNQKVGYLDRVISNDVGAGANILRGISELMLRMASLITYASIAFKLSISITVMSLVGGALILVVF